MSNLLKLIFIILILVTIGEVGYYFYVLKVNPLKEVNVTGQNVSVSPTDQPVENQETSTPQLLPESDLKTAIHPDQIKKMGTIVTNQQTNEKYYMYNETSGLVTDLDFKGKQVGKTLFPFGIKYKSGEIDDWWYLSPVLASRIEVYIQQGDTTKKAKTEDIKVGDNVILQEVVDMSYSLSDPEHSKAFVIKIQR